MNKSKADLYDPKFVRGMFYRMSKAYGFANLITSFGFTSRCRRQCVNDLPKIERSACGFDMTSGMGESWTEIQKRINAEGQVIAVDLSGEMKPKSKRAFEEIKNKNIKLRQANILNSNISSDSADFIVSTFGIRAVIHN